MKKIELSDEEIEVVRGGSWDSDEDEQKAEEYLYRMHENMELKLLRPLWDIHIYV